MKRTNLEIVAIEARRNGKSYGKYMETVYAKKSAMTWHRDECGNIVDNRSGRILCPAKKKA